MPNKQLQNGVLLRQVLKGKRKVRISFIPDDVTHPTESTLIRLMDDTKSTWTKLLGNPPASLDINQGIILLRFNENGNGGIAKFYPNQSAQEEITHPFIQQDPVPLPPPGPIGSEDYLKCMENKRELLGADFNYAVAAAQCLPQLVM
jgi:hypothetical protein